MTENALFSDAECGVAIKLNEDLEKNGKNNEQQNNCYW